MTYQKVLAIRVFILENPHKLTHNVEAPTIQKFIIVLADFRHPSPLVVPIALYMSCSNGRRFHQAGNQEEILLFNYRIGDVVAISPKALLLVDTDLRLHSHPSRHQQERKQGENFVHFFHFDMSFDFLSAKL